MIKFGRYLYIEDSQYQISKELFINALKILVWIVSVRRNVPKHEKQKKIFLITLCDKILLFSGKFQQVKKVE